MSNPDIRKASLAEIETMHEQGKLFHDPDAAEGEQLGPDFWAKAQPIDVQARQSVLLDLDADVVEFFKRQGKGHLTRMQNVLKAYVNAHR